MLENKEGKCRLVALFCFVFFLIVLIYHVNNFQDFFNYTRQRDGSLTAFIASVWRQSELPLKYKPQASITVTEHHLSSLPSLSSPLPSFKSITLHTMQMDGRTWAAQTKSQQHGRTMMHGAG